MVIVDHVVQANLCDDSKVPRMEFYRKKYFDSSHRLERRQSPAFIESQEERVQRG